MRRAFPTRRERWVPVLDRPGVLAEVTTLLLLRLSPLVRVTRASCCSFALLLGVWAVWALAAGFGYPSAPVPIALNIASKLLAFVTALTLFLPRPSRDSADRAPWHGVLDELRVADHEGAVD